MKYIVKVNGERVEVDVGPEGARVDDTDPPAHLADLGKGREANRGCLRS